jgi:YVTN family beta-propeller protein
MMQIKAVVGVMLVLTLAGGGAVLFAVNAANSSILRTVDVGAYPESVAVDGPSGRIVVGNDDGGVSVLEARSGRVLYTVKGGSSSGGALAAVDTDAGHAFMSDFGTGVRMLDTRAGTILHTLMVGAGLSAVAVDGRLRRAFVTDARRQAVLVLDTRRGTVVQVVKVGPNPYAVAVDTQSGRVFVAWGAHRVSVLDARSGRVLRTLTGLGRTIAVDEKTRRVFVANPSDDTVSVLDAWSATVLRRVRVGHVPDALAVDGRRGHVFVANWGSLSVRMLDAKSGTVLTTSSVAVNPVALAVDQRVGRVFAVGVANPMDQKGGNNFLAQLTYAIAYQVGRNGAVSVLDARSGAVIRTVRVGQFPAAVAVDERVGRAFVTNTNSNSVSVLDTHAFR